MILITRQRNFAAQTSTKLEQLGYKALNLPMLHISYMYKEIVDNDYDLIVMTGQNSVYASSHIDWLKNKKVYAVGSETANLLQKSGYKNIIFCQESSQNSDTLISLIKKNEQAGVKILYISGADIAGNIEKQLLDAGYLIKREVVYKSILTENLSEQAIGSINDLIKLVLFYSPRTALAFSNLAKKYKINLSAKSAVCISEKTAAKLNKDEWGKIIIAKISSEASIIEAIITA
ncbi:MAG: uroporphyrinogen-III synthase [Candidatus Midichloria sp.]|nr:uroporphyrinogen-III synthase [Candidatus Midichloria sp.]